MDQVPFVSDAIAKKRNLKDIQRHLFICIGDECCSPERGLEVWTYLKKQMATRGLSEGPNARVLRNKVGCLRICADGPVAVVYPEGTWYRLVDEQAIDTIITDHLIGGRPVAKYAFATTTLSEGELPEQGAPK